MKTQLRKKRLLQQRQKINNRNTDCQNNLEATYAYYNKMRTDSGMIPLKRNEILEQGATNHAEYLYENFEYIPHDLTLHNEDDSFIHFTGVKSWDRAISAGHNTGFISEGIAFTGKAKNAIDGLMTAIYHRFGILNFFMDEVGLSNYIVSSNCMFSFVHNSSLSVLDDLCLQELNTSGRPHQICKESKTLPMSLFSKSVYDIAKQNPPYVLYPPNNGKNIIRKFYGEIPDPMPDKEFTGNPVSIQFNRKYYRLKSIEMISFRMQEVGTYQFLEGRILKKDTDPNKRFNENEYAFFPFEVYKPYTKYIVEFKYTLKGVEQDSIVWTFTTNKREDYRKN